MPSTTVAWLACPGSRWQHHGAPPQCHQDWPPWLSLQLPCHRGAQHVPGQAAWLGQHQPPPAAPALEADGPMRLLLLPSALIWGRALLHMVQLLSCTVRHGWLSSSPPLCWGQAKAPDQNRPQGLPGLYGHRRLFLPTGKCQAQSCSVASIMEQRCQTGTTKPTEMLRSTAHPSQAPQRGTAGTSSDLKPRDNLNIWLKCAHHQWSLLDSCLI